MIIAFGLTACATMESAGNATKDAAVGAYDWAFGDDDKKDESIKK